MTPRRAFSLSPDYWRARHMREEGLSIRAVAARLGRPVSTVGYWLAGEGETHMRRACKLCGEDFFSQRENRVFCSPRCAMKHYKVYGRNDA